MIGVVVFVTTCIILIFVGVRSCPGYQTLIGESSWVMAVLVHIPQFIIPFIIICIISKWQLGEYGYNCREKPPLFTHRRMFALGFIFGLLLSLKYFVQLIRGAPIEIPLPVTTMDVVGNLVFQWIVIGFSEETMFRGLIQTYLTKNLRGSYGILGHELQIGTIIGAFIWGGFHLVNLLVMPVGPTIFYAVITTFAGVALGYAFQETGSLMTTIIVHNTIFGVPLIIGYILYWI